MRSFPIRLWVVLATALLSQPALAMRRAGVALRVDRPPVVDGSLVDWSPGLYGLAPAIPLGPGSSQVEAGSGGDEADFSAELFAVVWERTLFVAARVTDDRVVSEHRGGEIWRGDGVSILIASPQGGYLHVGVGASGDLHVFRSAHATRRGPEGQLRAAARVGPPGYSVEVAIPLDAFGASSAAHTLSVNFAARDADPDEHPPTLRSWSGPRHNTTPSFGTLAVLPGTDSSPRWPRCPRPPSEVPVEAPLTARDQSLWAGDRPVTLRMVNFQSAERSWVQFWTGLDLRQVQTDLDRAARLGTNAIRLFVFFEAFGGDRPTEAMVNKLAAVIELAAQRGMVSVVSFFPFKKDFRPERWPEMEAHLRAIVRRFQGEPAIAMWDLMNEPDHAWALSDGGVTPGQVSAWARHMASAVRDADPTHLLTVGLAGHFATRTGPIHPDEALPFVDVVSVHFYFEPERLGPALARAKSLGKPVVLQEFGSTGLHFDEAEASAQYAEVCAHARRAALSGVGAWELYDHPVGSILHHPQPWREADEHYFGLLRRDGTPKRQAAEWCRCLEAPRLRVRFRGLPKAG